MLEQPAEENNFQPVKVDLKDYILALEHIENIYNRLCCQKKLGEQCKDCTLITAITTLKEFAQIEQVKALEKNLGFTLPE